MKKYSVEIKWALVFFFMTIVWMFLEKISGLHSVHIDKHPIYTNFIAIPAVAIYVLALMEKKKVFYGSVMTYKEGFKCGFIMTIIITVLSPLLQIIISNIVTPEFFPNAIQYAVNSGKVSLEEAKKYFSLESYIFQGLIGSFVMGIVTTAIVAFFIKSKNS